MKNWSALDLIGSNFAATLEKKIFFLSLQSETLWATLDLIESNFGATQEINFLLIFLNFE